MTISAETLMNSVCKIIRDQFPSIPEGKLMAGVVEQAVRDLWAVGDDAAELKAEAREYLMSEMRPAELSGVESSWVRHIITQFGVYDFRDAV